MGTLQAPALGKGALPPHPGAFPAHHGPGAATRLPGLNGPLSPPLLSVIPDLNATPEASPAGPGALPAPNSGALPTTAPAGLAAQKSAAAAVPLDGVIQAPAAISKPPEQPGHEQHANGYCSAEDAQAGVALAAAPHLAEVPPSAAAFAQNTQLPPADARNAFGAAGPPAAPTAPAKSQPAMAPAPLDGPTAMQGLPSPVAAKTDEAPSIGPSSSAPEPPSAPQPSAAGPAAAAKAAGMSSAERAADMDEVLEVRAPLVGVASYHGQLRCYHAGSCSLATERPDPDELDANF